MTRLRDALTAVTERIEALSARLFPEEKSEDSRRVIDVAPIAPPRRRSPRERRPPRMEYVMPRMGYRYHLSWTPPDSTLKRWWRKVTRQREADCARASPRPLHT